MKHTLQYSCSPIGFCVAHLMYPGFVQVFGTDPIAAGRVVRSGKWWWGLLVLGTAGWYWWWGVW